MSKSTTRFAIPYPEDADAPDGPAQQKAIAEAVDAALARAGAQAKKKAVASAGTRNSASYGFLTGEEDKVTGLVLPTDGIIEVDYRAMVKSAGAEQAIVAIFLTKEGGSATQLKTLRTGAAVSAPVTEAAMNATAEDWGLIQTCPFGLVHVGTNAVGAGYGGDVTTGQTLGSIIDGNDATFIVNEEGAPLNPATDIPVGSPVQIVAAAGTYQVDVRYRVRTSSTLEAKNRVLRVATKEFA